MHRPRGVRHPRARSPRQLPLCLSRRRFGGCNAAHLWQSKRAASRGYVGLLMPPEGWPVPDLFALKSPSPWELPLDDLGNLEERPVRLGRVREGELVVEGLAQRVGAHGIFEPGDVLLLRDAVAIGK